MPFSQSLYYLDQNVTNLLDKIKCYVDPSYHTFVLYLCDAICESPRLRRGTNAGEPKHSKSTRTRVSLAAKTVRYVIDFRVARVWCRLSQIKKDMCRVSLQLRVACRF